MSLWYRTGTINLTNGSTALTGTGTAWVANVSPGMMVVYDRQIIGEVAAVVSDTSITLATAYAGTTISGGAYAIANLGAVRDGLIAAVNDALAVFQAAQDGALSGRFGDGTVSEPGIAFLSDINTGFRRPAADQISMVTGGAQRALLSSTALNLTVPITGSAVQSSPTDATAGRVLTVGAFGLGAVGTPANLADLDAITTPAGFHRVINTAAGTFPEGASLFGVMQVERYSPSDIVQTYKPITADAIYTRRYTGGAWQSWGRIYTQASLLGTVSQSGGVPTGAVIERGSNANGDYVRFADGTQICWHTLTIGAINVAEGAGFASAAAVNWTFPAAFAAGTTPAVTGASPNVGRGWVSPFLSSNTLCSVLGLRLVSTTSSSQFRVTALGRWF